MRASEQSSAEVVVVTNRDEVVAKLSTPRRDRALPEAVTQMLDGLAAAGEITRAAAARKGWRWTPTGLGLSSGAAAVRDDLRADSRGR